MLRLETKADLQRLVDDEIRESLTLDYKASVSLGRRHDQRSELFKDISAFANSVGGQIIYGIEEIDRKPVRIDAGSSIDREWMEHIIDTNVQPRIEGLTIRSIELGAKTHAYVIDIPAAVASAPHQASDHKYYKRQNFQSVPMEDYEIRDVFRRARSPELFANIQFEDGKTTANVTPRSRTTLSEPIKLVMKVGNKSPQPAYYSMFSLYIDSQLFVNFSGTLAAAGPVTWANGQAVNKFVRKIGVPGDFPVFREMELPLSTPPFSFQAPNALVDGGHEFSVAYELRTPGHQVTQFGKLKLASRQLEIQMDSPVNGR